MVQNDHRGTVQKLFQRNGPGNQHKRGQTYKFIRQSQWHSCTKQAEVKNGKAGFRALHLQGQVLGGETDQTIAFGSSGTMLISLTFSLSFKLSSRMQKLGPSSPPGHVTTSNKLPGRGNTFILLQRQKWRGGGVWWSPKQQWKGNVPAEDTGWKLWAYLTQGSCWHQQEGFWETIQWRDVSRGWLARCAWPLAWGWNPDVEQTDMPSNFQNAFQNFGPLPDTMLNWRPCYLKTLVVISWAVSGAEGSLGKGTKWMTKTLAFRSRNTRTKIQTDVWPRFLGNGQRLEWISRRLIGELVLVLVTSGHKHWDISPHGWPPEVLF